MLDINKIVGKKSDYEPVEREAKWFLPAEQDAELTAVLEEIRQADESNDLNFLTKQVFAAFLQPRIDKRKKDEAKAEKAAKRAEREASKKVTNIKTKAA